MTRPARPPRNCTHSEWRAYCRALDTFHKSRNFANVTVEVRP